MEPCKIHPQINHLSDFLVLWTVTGRIECLLACRPVTLHPSPDDHCNSYSLYASSHGAGILRYFYFIISALTLSYVLSVCSFLVLMSMWGILSGHKDCSYVAQTSCQNWSRWLILQGIVHSLQNNRTTCQCPVDGEPTCWWLDVPVSVPDYGMETGTFGG